MYHCLSFCLFSIDHCIVCSSIYGCWLPLWHLQNFLLFFCKNNISVNSCFPAVEEKEVTKSPEIVQYLQDISAQDGSQTKLVCKVTGLPRPSVTWYKEDEVIYPSEEFKLSYEGDECTLVIADVYPEDAGHYKVVAKNDVGTATTTCDLTVLGRH